MHIPAHKQVSPAAAPAQLTSQTLWMNVYRAGWYHRIGKPGCLDMHSGDFYTSEESARKQINPMSHYLGTISFQWLGPRMEENPEDSEPISLAVSRKQASEVTEEDYEDEPFMPRAEGEMAHVLASMA